jgi:hypothetical protein
MPLTPSLNGGHSRPASFLVQWHEGALLLSAGQIVALDVQDLKPDVLAEHVPGWQAPRRQEFIAE